MDVYLLVGHRQLQSDQAEEQVFLKLPNLDQERQKHLAEVYRQLPDPLRLVLLLSIYDELEDDEIARLLRCSAERFAISCSWQAESSPMHAERRFPVKASHLCWNLKLTAWKSQRR